MSKRQALRNKRLRPLAQPLLYKICTQLIKRLKRQGISAFGNGIGKNGYEQAKIMAQALKQQLAIPSPAEQGQQASHDPIDWQHVQRQALQHYDKSLDAKTRNEQTVYHRGKAKEYAYQLRAHLPAKVVALNLLARIALDEGFYGLAEHHLAEALSIEPDDAGCWYSLGHVRLAQKKNESALACFDKALAITPKQTRAAILRAYTLACLGNVVEAFQAYRELYKTHPNDLHIQAKLFEITPLIKADYYQADLEQDVLRWLSVKNINHQALSGLTMSLLKYKYQLDDPNAVIDLQDLARDKLLNRSLGKIYFTDNKLEEFIQVIRKQVLLNCIAGEYKDRPLLKLAGNLAMHAEHNEQVYLYDQQEKDLLAGIKALIIDVANKDAKNLHQFSHLLALYGMYEPLAKLDELVKAVQTQTLNFQNYAKNLIQHAVIDVQQEIKLAQKIPQLATITHQTSLDVKEQYEENPYPRWLHLGYNTPTNYGRALERELVGFRAPEFFNMGTVKVLIAGAGTGRHALRVARYFRNVEVLALDLSRRSLAYAQRKASDLNITNIRFLNGDILQLDKLDEQFHVIECSGVLHHMTEPERGLAMLKEKLVDRGLLKLGLYSYRARAIVRQMRDLIAQYELSPSAEGIRTMRQAILTGKMPYDFSGILSSQDFYSLSGCRDLLFHVQEIQYEPIELKSFIAAQKLRFLGFVIPDSVRAEFREMFADDERLLSLENWQSFEAKHPNTFAGMFQFYVQK